MITRFFNEARAANTIQHPGIVEVLDFGRLASGASYIVMELLDGESLAARIGRGGRLAPEAAVGIAVQAASALGAAHAKGIVHRDLKPDNLFVVPDPQFPARERVKVLDFGIAKLAGGLQASASSVKTRTGVLMGTPIYMSPEQCRGTRVIDHRSDLYALGVILFEMVCGTPPFLSEGQGELIHMHIAEPPPSPRRFNPEVSEALEATILRALAKDPAQRFQSMEDLAEALRNRPARDLSAPRVERGSATLLDEPPRRTPATLPSPMVPTPARTLKLPEEEPLPAPQPRPHAPSGRASAPVTTLSASAGAASLPSRRSRALPLTLGALLLAGGGAVAFVLKPWAAAPAPVEAPASPAPPVAPAPARHAPAPRTVSVRVTSKPSGARLTRESDGTVLGLTPFVGSAPPRAGTDRVKVDLAGYAEELLVLPLDQDVELTVSLKPSAAAASEGPTKKHGRARSAPRPTPQAQPAPERAEPVKPPTAEPVPL